MSFLSLDLCEEAIQIAKVRNVSLDTGYISSDLLYRRSQLRLTTPGNENVRAFVRKLLRRRKANAASAARYNPLPQGPIRREGITWHAG